MEVLIPEMEAFFQFKPREAASAKVATCDNAEGLTKGVIFFHPNVKQPSNEIRGTFKAKNWVIRDQFRERIQEVCDFLNTLSPEAAFHAKVCLTYRFEGESAIVLWYPSA